MTARSRGLGQDQGSACEVAASSPVRTRRCRVVLLVATLVIAVAMSASTAMAIAPGAKPPEPKTIEPARERIMYDAPVKHAEAAPAATPSPSEITLRNGTPIHLKLGKTISSATAHVGDIVDLTVMEEVIVDGISVIPAGSSAIGIVSEAEPKKRMGHGGKLAFSVNFVRLKDDEKAVVRSFQETTGSNNSAGAILPLSSGKEVVFTQGMEFTAYVDGDMPLKREDFQAERNRSSPAPASPDRKP